MYLENRQKLLMINKSNKNDVIEKLGQPHSRSIKGEDTLIYIERTKTKGKVYTMSLIHISEHTRLLSIGYAVLFV